jgi:hypothetical protein
VVVAGEGKDFFRFKIVPLATSVVRSGQILISPRVFTKVENLGTTSTMLALKREDGNKIRVTSMLREGPKVIS